MLLKRTPVVWQETERPLIGIFFYVLLFNFFGKDNITSAEDVKQQTETLFAFEDPNPKEQLEEFLRVFTSKDFLRMLFSDAVVNKFVDFHADECAFFWWNIEPSENPSEIFFSLRARQAWDKTLDCGGVQTNVLLDITPMFAYDIRKDTVRFIGLKKTPIVNVLYAEDVNLPMYSRSDAKTSVQKGNLMDVD